MRITIQDFASMTSGLAAGTTKGGGSPVYTPAGAPDILSYQSATIASEKDLSKSLSEALNAVGKNVNAARKESNNLAFTQFQNELEPFLDEQAKAAKQTMMQETETNLHYDKSKEMLGRMRDDALKDIETKFSESLKNPYIAQRWQAIKPRYAKAASDYLAQTYQNEVTGRVAMVTEYALSDLKEALRKMHGNPKLTNDDKKLLLIEIWPGFKEKLSDFNVPDYNIELLYEKALADGEIFFVKSQIKNKETLKTLPKTFSALKAKYPLAAKLAPLRLLDVFETYGAATQAEKRGLGIITMQEAIFTNPGFMLKHKTYDDYMTWAKGETGEYATAQNVTETDFKALRLRARNRKETISLRVDTKAKKNAKESFYVEAANLVANKGFIQDPDSVATSQITIRDLLKKSEYSAFPDLISDPKVKILDAQLGYRITLFGVTDALKAPDSTMSFAEAKQKLAKLGQDYVNEHYSDENGVNFSSPDIMTQEHNNALNIIKAAEEQFNADQGGFAGALVLKNHTGEKDLTPSQLAYLTNKEVKRLSNGQSKNVYHSKATKDAYKDHYLHILSKKPKNPDEVGQQFEELRGFFEEIEEVYDPYLAGRLLYSDAIIPDGIDRGTHSAVLIAAKSKDRVLFSAAAYALNKGDQLSALFKDHAAQAGGITAMNEGKVRGIVSRRMEQEYMRKGDWSSLWLNQNLEDFLESEQDEGLANDVFWNWGTDRQAGLSTGLRATSGEFEKTYRDGLVVLAMSKAMNLGLGTKGDMSRIANEVHNQATSDLILVPQLSGATMIIDKDYHNEYDPDMRKELGEFRLIEYGSAAHQVVLNQIANGNLLINEKTVDEMDFKNMSPEQREKWEEIMENTAKLEDETSLELVLHGEGMYQVVLVSKVPGMGFIAPIDTPLISMKEIDQQVLRLRTHKLSKKIAGALEHFRHVTSVKAGMSLPPGKALPLSTLLGKPKDTIGLTKEELLTVGRIKKRILDTYNKGRDKLDNDPSFTYPELHKLLENISNKTEPHKTLSWWSDLTNLTSKNQGLNTKHELWVQRSVVPKVIKKPGEVEILTKEGMGVPVENVLRGKKEALPVKVYKDEEVLDMDVEVLEENKRESEDAFD